jgi:hypothetical protein
MRSGLKKRICAAVLLLSITWLYGCGSSDILDEQGQRYQGEMSIIDNGEAKLTIDTVQDMCDTEPEDFTDAFAEVTIEVTSGAPGLTLDHYTLEYFPLQSENGRGVLVMPPELDDPGIGYYDIDIPSGSTTTFEITCLTVDTKEEHEYKLYHLWLANPALYESLSVCRYTIRVTLYFTDTAGEDETITLDRTVYLGNYNNC